MAPRSNTGCPPCSQWNSRICSIVSKEGTDWWSFKKCLDTMNGAAVVRTMAHTVADWLLHQYKVQVQAIFQKSWPLWGYEIIYLINNWPHSSTMWGVSQRKNSSILAIVFHWVHLVFVRSVSPSSPQFSLASTLVTTTGSNATITLYTWRIQKKAVQHNETHQQVLISLAWSLLFVLLYTVCSH